jgi:hypothetical protein
MNRVEEFEPGAESAGDLDGLGEPRLPCTFRISNCKQNTADGFHVDSWV